MVQKSLRLPDHVVSAIDDARGDVSWSRWVLRALEQALGVSGGTGAGSIPAGSGPVRASVGPVPSHSGMAPAPARRGGLPKIAPRRDGVTSALDRYLDD